MCLCVIVESADDFLTVIFEMFSKITHRLERCQSDPSRDSRVLACASLGPRDGGGGR